MQIRITFKAVPPYQELQMLGLKVVQALHLILVLCIRKSKA